MSVDPLGSQGGGLGSPDHLRWWTRLKDDCRRGDQGAQQGGQGHGHWSGEEKSVKS